MSACGRGDGGRGGRPGHAVAPQQDQVADLAVLDPLVEFLAGARSGGPSGRRATLRFFSCAFLFSSSIRTLVGASTVTGFSMKTLSPFSMA